MPKKTTPRKPKPAKNPTADQAEALGRIGAEIVSEHPVCPKCGTVLIANHPDNCNCE